jgi:hypothetical protein
VIAVPTQAPDGEILVIDGGGVDVTVKLLLPLVPVWPATVTVRGPVAAPAGTVTVNEVVVAALTVAATPLKNVTAFAERVVLKLVPVIETAVPTGPVVGEKLVIVGAGGAVTVKFVLLVAVCPPTVT